MGMLRLGVYVLLFAAAACAVEDGGHFVEPVPVYEDTALAGGDGAATTGGGTTGGVPDVSGTGFYGVYALIGPKRCGSCHTSAPFAGGLDLSTVEAAYHNLVNQSAACAGMTLVIPGDAANSVLWQKLAQVDTCGNKMPIGRRALADDEVARIAAWIDAGAPLGEPDLMEPPTTSGGTTAGTETTTTGGASSGGSGQGTGGKSSGGE